MTAILTALCYEIRTLRNSTHNIELFLTSLNQQMLATACLKGADWLWADHKNNSVNLENLNLNLQNIENVQNFQSLQTIETKESNESLVNSDGCNEQLEQLVDPNADTVFSFDEQSIELTHQTVIDLLDWVLDVELLIPCVDSDVSVMELFETLGAEMTSEALEKVCVLLKELASGIYVPKIGTRGYALSLNYRHRPRSSHVLRMNDQYTSAYIANCILNVI